MGSLAAAFDRLAPRRVHGISATLLPYTPAGTIDFDAFAAHVERTREAGLDVAVNMDTGFGDLLSPAERAAVLDATRATLGADVVFYAGAFADGADVLAGYHQAIAAIEARGAVPVIIQHRAMHGLPAGDLAALYARIADGAARVLAFELGPMFAPHGAIWDDDTFRRLLDVERLAGAKHSSLDRGIELRRLAARDRHRRTSASTPATTSPLTWWPTAATTCSASPPSRPPRSPRATALFPTGTPRFWR
jgi:dihydrodipicolinate synthase/N-acetylneuraminate lyase